MWSLSKIFIASVVSVQFTGEKLSYVCTAAGQQSIKVTPWTEEEGRLRLTSGRRWHCRRKSVMGRARWRAFLTERAAGQNLEPLQHWKKAVELTLRGHRVKRHTWLRRWAGEVAEVRSGKTEPTNKRFRKNLSFSQRAMRNHWNVLNRKVNYLIDILKNHSGYWGR